MGIIPKYSELKALSDAELIERYEKEAQHTVVGTGFYLDELSRRTQEHQSDRMLKFTKQMRNMTIAIVILTLLNAVLVGVTVFRWSL